MYVHCMILVPVHVLCYYARTYCTTTRYIRGQRAVMEEEGIELVPLGLDVIDKRLSDAPKARKAYIQLT